MKIPFSRIVNSPLFRIFDRSLKARLVVFFAFITVITVSTVGFISYVQVKKTIERSTTDSTRVIAEQLKTNIGLMFRDAERFLKIGTHGTTMAFLSSLEQSEESTYRLSLEIIDLFNLFREIYEFDSRIKGIHILGFNGNNIGEQEGRYELDENLSDIQTVQTAMKRPGEVYLIPNKTIDYAGIESYEDVISITRIIVRPVTRELMGVIIVDVDRQAITALCENIRIGETGHFSIISDRGDVIYPPELDISAIPISVENTQKIIKGSSGSLVDHSGGVDELYTYSTLDPWSWKIVGRVKVTEIMKNAYRIRNLTVLAIILSLVLSTVLYFLFSDAITHPIHDLMAVMKLAESGNLSVRANSKRHDEINDLCNGFNRMLGEIRGLMNRVISEHEDLQKSELKALQAQINPHFLYNTLDAIVWMAEAGSTDNVIHMTKSLSNFFRLSLSKGREWVSCHDELEHVRCYLEIQKMRHADLLDYDICRWLYRSLSSSHAGNGNCCCNRCIPFGQYCIR